MNSTNESSDEDFNLVSKPKKKDQIYSSNTDDLDVKVSSERKKKTVKKIPRRRVHTIISSSSEEEDEHGSSIPGISTADHAASEKTNRGGKTGEALNSGHNNEEEDTLKSTKIKTDHDNEEQYTPKATKTKMERRKIKCPVCPSSIINFSRHFQKVHGYSKENARNALTHFNLRKKFKRAPNKVVKVKDYHKRTSCPVRGCIAIVKRLSNHLRYEHNMTAVDQLTTFGNKIPTQQQPEMEASSSSEAGSSCSSTETESSSSSDEYQMPSQISKHKKKKKFHAEDSSSESGTKQLKNIKMRTKSKKRSSQKPLSDFISKFKKYLKRKGLESITVQSQLQRVTYTLRILGSDSYRDLFNVKKAYREISSMTIRKKKKVSSQTRRSYLGALMHVADFFIANPSYDSSLTDVKIAKFRQDIKDFSKSMRKEIMKEHWRKSKKDLDTMAKAKDIQNYDSCSSRRKIIELFEQIETGDQPPTQNLSLLLGFMCLEISLDNANRAGEARHMKVREFKEAKLRNDYSGEIWVGKHKTSDLYGESPLFINPTLMRCMRIYNTITRPALSSSSSAFFLNQAGKKMHSSAIKKYMQSFWNFCSLSGCVGPSLIRKSSTTVIHHAQPELIDKLATKMNHTVATARRHYALYNKSKNAEEIGRKLRQVIIDSASSQENIQISGHSANSRLDCAPTSSNDAQKILSQTCSYQNPQSSFTMPVDTQPENSPQPETNSQHENLPCETVLTSAETITSTYPETVNSSATLHFLHQQQSSFVRETSNNSYLDADDYEPNTEENASVESTFCSNIREEFSVSQLCLLYNEFYNVIEKNSKVMLTEALIRKKLNRTQAGRNVIKSYGMFKIRNKVKYLKRKEKDGKNSQLAQLASSSC